MNGSLLAILFCSQSSKSRLALLGMGINLAN